MSGSDCCDDVMWSSIPGIMTATLAPVVATPAPVVEYILLAPTFQTAPATMTVTGVDRNRVGIPDVLQQLQVGHGAPVLYGAPVNFGSTMTVTGVDVNRDGIPDVLQQPLVGYSVPVPYGAPVGAAPTFQTVTAQPGYQYGAPQEVQYGTRCSMPRKHSANVSSIVFAPSCPPSQHSCMSWQRLFWSSVPRSHGASRRLSEAYGRHFQVTLPEGGGKKEDGGSAFLGVAVEHPKAVKQTHRCQ